MSEEELYAPRSVKPRTRRYKRMPVIAMDNQNPMGVDDALYEDGTIRHFDYNELPDMEPTLFTRVGSADWLASINKMFEISHPTTWQYRVSSNERGIVRPDGLKLATRVTVAIHFFGFKGGNYHKLIDPVTMYGHGLDTIWPGDEPRIIRLLSWAQTIRDFCDQNALDVRPTIGGIGAQFLTDRRFYPQARRKTPRTINERARENLPGNHYALTVAPNPNEEFTAWYLDQHQAHHYHARTASLPSSNSLYAYGRFADLAEIVWKEVPDDFKGLLCLDLQAPKKKAPFDWINRRTKAFKDGHNFIFTNELDHILDMGYVIKGVRAAWGSFERDMGLARYATWAGQQLADCTGNVKWLKPLLLATYGTLAIKAGYGETIFRLSKGTPVEVLTGHHTLPGMLSQRKKKLDPGIANVIHRGMIEAGCRSESIGLAQWLTTQKYQVLCIYADAIIVRQDDDNPNLPVTSNGEPFLPEPWRIKSDLNHLQFVSKQAFISGEMTKLPGVTRELKGYATHRHAHTAPTKPMYEALSGRKLTAKEIDDKKLKRKKI